MKQCIRCGGPLEKRQRKVCLSCLFPEKTCPICKVRFTAQVSTQTFCSYKCKGAAQKIGKSFVLRCKHCSREFEAQLSELPRSFCSRSCGDEARRGVPRPTIVTHCVVCSKRLEDSDIFCSHECLSTLSREKSKGSTEQYLHLSGMAGHPLAFEGSVPVHRLVLWAKLKCRSLDCVHACELCGKQLTWGTRDGINADHVNGNTFDNRPKNLRPLCHRCNIADGQRRSRERHYDEFYGRVE